MTIPENELQKFCETIKNCSELLSKKSITKIIKYVITPDFLKHFDSKSFHLAKYGKNKRIRKKNFDKLYKLILALFRPGQKLSFSCPNYWRCII